MERNSVCVLSVFQPIVPLLRNIFHISGRSVECNSEYTLGKVSNGLPYRPTFM